MKFLFLILLSGASYASHSEGAHHTSPMDLIPAFFNIFLLGGFLVWKLKGGAKKYFEDKATSISGILDRANVKAKEAQMMMEMQQKKIDNLEGEITKINSDIESQISSFKTNYNSDVQNRIEKLKVDASMKIESEKNELTNELNKTLIDSVISKTKEKLKNNKELNNQATAKILEGLK